MKFLFAAALGLASVYGEVQVDGDIVAAVYGEVQVDGDIVAAFQDFQTKYGKSYGAAEWAKRLGIFASNLEKVSLMNDEHMLSAGNPVHGITQFMDMTPDEFSATYLGFIPRNDTNTDRASIKLNGVTAESVDWRTKGAVTPVKDQGQCGSCWAVSATEAIESYNFLNGGKLVELSPQQITSCDKVDEGCDGGDSETAYDYVMKAGGIETATAYPYTSGKGKSGSCQFDKAKVALDITGYTMVEKGADNLERALNNGPVSVCLAAMSFQFYFGGVLRLCPGQMDHCVQAVGYTQDYWIVRNSWGTRWGEKGFIRIARKNLFGHDLCKITQHVTFPTFADGSAPL